MRRDRLAKTYDQPRTTPVPSHNLCSRRITVANPQSLLSPLSYIVLIVVIHRNGVPASSMRTSCFKRAWNRALRSRML